MNLETLPEKDIWMTLMSPERSQEAVQWHKGQEKKEKREEDKP